jgi:hypothetical protein
MRPYFRDKKPLSRADEDYNLAAAIAEMRLDAFDDLLQFPDLMGFGSQAENWRNTVRDAFRDSPLMCDLVVSYKANFGPTIVKLSGITARAWQTAHSDGRSQRLFMGEAVVALM